VISPSAVPSPHSAQSVCTAALSPSQSLPTSSVPPPTVISAIAGAPQYCAMTGLAACASARSLCQIHCAASAPVKTTSSAAASTHTASANARSPGTRSGSVAAAIATIPVPMTAANQFGATPRTTSPSRCFSSFIPNGRGSLRNRPSWSSRVAGAS
jgi:hypothetical protein